MQTGVFSTDLGRKLHDSPLVTGLVCLLDRQRTLLSAAGAGIDLSRLRNNSVPGHPKFKEEAVQQLQLAVFLAVHTARVEVEEVRSKAAARGIKKGGVSGLKPFGTGLHLPNSVQIPAGSSAEAAAAGLHYVP